MNKNDNLADFKKITPQSNAMGQQTFINLMKFNKNLSQNSNKLITLEELNRHSEPHDCWIVFNGIVYDVTYYLKYHPGGYDHLLEYAAKDITDDFKRIHQWVNIDYILENCRIGKFIN